MRLTRRRLRSPEVVGSLLVLAVWLAQLPLTLPGRLGDLPVYEHTYRLMALGQAPYADFRLEYPPGAAALFWLAGALPGGYALVFSLLMCACLIATVVCVVGAARSLGLPRSAQWAGVALAAVTPLALGTIVHTRYDLAVTALLAGIAWAAAARRWTVLWLVVGVAVVVKLVPLALAPALLVAQSRSARPAAIVRSVLPGAVLVAAVLTPFLVASPDGLWQSVAYHLERPLQIESLGASALLVLHRLTGLDTYHVTGYGSDNLVGGAAELVTTASNLVGVAVLVGVLVVLVRQRRRVGDDAAWDRLVCGGLAATLAGLVATGKVLSPQYLLWLVPLVVLAAPRPRVAAAVLALAMVLSQLIFPLLYSSLTESFAALPVALLALRNALLVATVVIVWPRLGPSLPRRERAARLLARAGRRPPAREAAREA